MNFPVVEACGIDGFNETVAAWADQPEEHGNA